LAHPVEANLTQHIVLHILCSLHEVAEDCTPPCPDAVIDHVSRLGNEWSGVCVQLARPARRTSPLPAYVESWTHEVIAVINRAAVIQVPGKAGIGLKATIPLRQTETQYRYIRLCCY